jgi:hypothetical protein
MMLMGIRGELEIQCPFLGTFLLYIFGFERPANSTTFGADFPANEVNIISNVHKIALDTLRELIVLR